MMKKIISVLLAVFLLVSVIPLAANAAEGDSKTITINENGDYVLDENDYNAVDIDGVTGKITLADAGVFSTGRSAIKVKNNSDVTFVLEGFSTIEGDANAYSCGIEVVFGARRSVLTAPTATSRLKRESRSARSPSTAAISTLLPAEEAPASAPATMLTRTSSLSTAA